MLNEVKTKLLNNCAPYIFQIVFVQIYLSLLFSLNNFIKIPSRDLILLF